ncbi:hypothetical protein APY04_3546 [Hyphomicrobium sulfonivorans]|uniref:Uncharacterized protein n=1 Tax=Hyphomicrobium sulfonivorans TaxID=121290 RepID=A0A109B875_HYPSL|nr:DUF6600 domain-containing protein [Hyphomicrobium sulfonivorans]KWT64009.1 hypothetical protein APY04_3546 [Hyphomicrobium sulfonivorans]
MRSMLFAAFVGAIAWMTPVAHTWPPSLFDTSMAANREKHRDEFRYFFNGLKPHGQWTRHPRYGWIWMPSVSDRWRPYTVGRWVHTSQHGWIWDSYEAFGAIVYHYGWWDRDLRGHWFWVPGFTWAPAWVVWKLGATHIGWAPMPPGRVWGRSWRIALSPDWAPQHDPKPYEWCFVDAHRIAYPSVLQVVLPVEENTTHVDGSATMQSITVVNRTIFNRGIDLADLERRYGVRVDDADTNPSSALAGQDLKIMQPFGREAPPDDVVLVGPNDAIPASGIDADNATEAIAAQGRYPPSDRLLLGDDALVPHDHALHGGKEDLVAPTGNVGPSR